MQLRGQRSGNPSNQRWKRFLSRTFLSRYVNDGFSGGEKRGSEILQLMLLQPKLAILDETDSGLDIDGIRVVSRGINAAIRGSDSGALIITHYSRILEHVKPDHVHVLIEEDSQERWADLALELEEKGMSGLSPKRR